MSEHQPLPVSGYTAQSDERVQLVNQNKLLEEQLLRVIDALAARPESFDPRWTAIARTHIEQGFMALNRSVFRPQRIKLPSDAV